MPESRIPGGMPALVLTAGVGTRLRPLTYVRAKAAIPVNGDPLARRVVRWLASQGVRDVILNLHHLPESIAAVMGDGRELGVRLRYSWEQPLLGSAGGPRHALPLLVDDSADTFLVVNGDTLTALEISALLAAHAQSGALVTMAVIPNPQPHKYGGVAVASDGTVTGFTHPARDTTNYHFIGVQVVSARAFEGLPDGVPAESVAALYPRLIDEQHGSVRAFVCNVSFHDIGTPADYLSTSLTLATAEGDRLIPANATIHPTARIARTAVWDDVAIGANAHLTECVVGDGVRIPDAAEFTRCAIVAARGRAPREDERLSGDLLIRDF
jgi:mannose-1-phosphate guanylyltransferase